MKTIFHPAAARGHAQHDWLESWHSFSFAGYYDPEKIHFGLLRVLNDDAIAAGRGFGRHPHNDMEIISIPLVGALQHNDSTGRNEIIRRGEVQIMSAGSGIEHSEVNASETDPAKFLQIWIFPKEKGISPQYAQKIFPEAGRINKLQTVVAPGGQDDALPINQDAWLSLGHFTEKTIVKYQVKKEGNGVYVFVLEGSVRIGEHTLLRRDALGVAETADFPMEIEPGSDLLLIDIPMR
ncbi:MAG TPA: pirin family protein [Bacteroidia bacterium]|nr:pirin family protein [Bacteroidia bacterium]